ncbi:MAG: ABC transporter substrate-binding protein [Bacteroidia bacterium]|nr:ABC transporter substrate-binding protein [Bacteroidia bacterium]
MIFKTIFNCLIDFNRFYIFINIILGLTFCSCNESNTEKERKIFRYNSENGITSLDPAFARTQDNIWAVSQLFNGLVQLDNNLKVKPCIAKSWEISENGLQYTFYLRNDIFFHNSKVFNNNKSRKVVAADFVFSFNRIIDEKTASPGSWIFNDKIAENPFVALNDTVFQINLQKPFPPFLGMLSMPYCFVIPKEAIDFYKKDFGRNPVGTGPFVFSKWNEEVKLIFLKNEQYFETENGNKLPYIEAVAISFLDDKQAAFLEFLQGNLSFFNGVESSFKDEIINKNGTLKSKYSSKFKTLITPFLNTEYIAFLIDDSLKNSVTHPLYDKNLRLAIHYAIDKKSLIKHLRNNIGYAADGGFVPIGLKGYRKDENLSYNVEKAKYYLSKSKWIKNKKAIVLYTTKDYLDICLFVQNDLKRAGIDIKIEVQPASFLKEEKSNNKLNFFRGSWIADYPDAENYLACFYSQNFSPSGPNYTHFKNKEFDKFYESIFNTVNETEREKIYYQMEDILKSECPVIPLFYDQSLRLINKKVKNLENNPSNSLDLKNVKIE